MEKSIEIAPASGSQFALLPPDNATGNFTKVVQRIPVKVVLDAGHPLQGSAAAGIFRRGDDPRVGRRWAELTTMNTPAEQPTRGFISRGARTPW